jgi:hypothetical protein
MKQFIVCFYQCGKTEFFKGDGNNGDIIEFKEGTLIKVSEDEMFKWLEKSHHECIKLAIYEARIVVDLS